MGASRGEGSHESCGKLLRRGRCGSGKLVGPCTHRKERSNDHMVSAGRISRSTCCAAAIVALNRTLGKLASSLNSAQSLLHGYSRRIRNKLEAARCYGTATRNHFSFPRLFFLAGPV